MTARDARQGHTSHRALYATPHGHVGLAKSVTRITWLHGLYDKRLRQFLLRRNGNDMPHNMTLSSRVSFRKTRIFIAKMSVRFSTRLIFFARWLAPELWEGER